MGGEPVTLSTSEAAKAGKVITSRIAINFIANFILGLERGTRANFYAPSRLLLVFFNQEYGSLSN